MYLFTSGFWCINKGLIRMAIPNWCILRIRTRCKDHRDRFTGLSSIWQDRFTNRRPWYVWKAIWTDFIIVASTQTCARQLLFVLKRTQNEFKVQRVQVCSRKIATIFRLLHMFRLSHRLHARRTLCFSRLTSPPAVHWTGIRCRPFIFWILSQPTSDRVAHRSDIKVA